MASGRNGPDPAGEPRRGSLARAGAEGAGRDENWVLLGLLLAAAHADGRIGPVEESDLEHIAAGIPHARQDRDALAETANEHRRALAQNRRRHLKLLCAAAPKEPSFRAMAFARCAELVFADREARRGERAFLERLAIKLGLPGSVENDIAEVIAWKCAFKPKAARQRALLLAPGPGAAPRPVGEPEWTRGQCVLAVLLAAAYCDGSLNLADDDGLDALIASAPRIQDVVGDDKLWLGETAEERIRSRSEVVARVKAFNDTSFKPMLNFRGLGAIVEKAARTLPRDGSLRRALVALSAEIALADQDLTAAEEQYFHDLGRRFGVSSGARAKILRAMAWRRRRGLAQLAAAFRR